MGNICSSPQPSTPAEAMFLRKHDVTKITFIRLVDSQTDANSSKEHVIDTEGAEGENLKTILEYLNAKSDWAYGNCTKQDFEGVYSLTLHCEDGVTRGMFVGMHATSVSPDFNAEAESQPAYKSAVQKADLTVETEENVNQKESAPVVGCPLFVRLELLAMTDVKAKSAKAADDEVIDEFDEPELADSDTSVTDPIQDTQI